MYDTKEDSKRQRKGEESLVLSLPRCTISTSAPKALSDFNRLVLLRIRLKFRRLRRKPYAVSTSK